MGITQGSLSHMSPKVRICMCIVIIKTHDSELRGQQEPGRMRQMSELFIGSTALKLVNALNKPP